MANITLSAFLAEVPSIASQIISSVEGLLQLLMTPPVSIFVGAAVLAVGIRYGIRIMKRSKSMA
jgi:hypothetical protein